MFRLCAAVLLVLVAAAGITRWIKASDHKDSALLAADHAADIADVHVSQPRASGQRRPRDDGVGVYSAIRSEHHVLRPRRAVSVEARQQRRRSRRPRDPGVRDRYGWASGDALPWPGAGVPNRSHESRYR